MWISGLKETDMKKGRPQSKNVFYFPHYTKRIPELELIEHRHGAEGYMAYYKLLELLSDADSHFILRQTEDQKDMFEMGMKVSPKVIEDVINILINTNRIDKKLWENEIIWMDDFVQSLKACYYNRNRPLPSKDDIKQLNNINNSISTTNNSISTTNNSISTTNNAISTDVNCHKRKEKKTKEKGSKDFPRINDKKQMENPNSSPDVIKLYQLFISDNNISPSKSEFSIVSEALDRQPLEFWKPIIAIYHKSGDKKVAKFFFESDYTKYLHHPSISYTYECPIDGCDKRETRDSKDLYKLCKEHPEEGSQKMVLIKY